MECEKKIFASVVVSEMYLHVLIGSGTHNFCVVCRIEAYK
jgi:hypothetical protein